MEQDNSSTDRLYTCITCHVAFRTTDGQRQHMRSDWHRYNLKRKVALLPPIALELFNERLNAYQQTILDQNTSSQSKNHYSCSICNKNYNSENAYNSHLESNKHKERVNSINTVKEPSKPKILSKYEPHSIVNKPQTILKNTHDKDNDMEIINKEDNEQNEEDEIKIDWKIELSKASTEEEVLEILKRKQDLTKPLKEAECLFCSYEDNDDGFEGMMEHMAKAHSFFIPDIEFLVDVKGLIKYLGEKINIDNLCIYCNGKGKAFYSIEAVRKHMSNKGHCKILYEDGGDLEISEFYDFSSTYNNFENDDDNNLDDEEWEDVDEDMNEDNDNNEEDDGEETENKRQLVTINYNDKSQEIVRSNNKRQFKNSKPILTEDQTELILPSGNVIGHRDYRIYWNQSININSPYSNNQNKLIKRIAGTYYMMGYQGKSQLEIKKEVHRRQMQARKELNISHIYKSKIGESANKLQKHFRSQIGFGA